MEDILRDVVESTDGAVATILMGFDGIPVMSYVDEAADINMETVGAEYSAVLAQIREAATMLEIGDTREVSVQAMNLTTIIRLLNDEFFIALALRPGGNHGKARFILRTKSVKLLDGLS